MRASRAARACWDSLDWAACFFRSSLSSSMVSNSETIWAKSSSALGSSRVFMALMVMVTSASSPSCSPPFSLEVKVTSSPALVPRRAVSWPSSMEPEPIS